MLGGLASSRLDNALVRGDESAVSVTACFQPFHRVGMFEVQVDVKPGQDADAVSRAARRRSSPSSSPRARPRTKSAASSCATSPAAIRALEPVGGFGGKAVVLAEGALYADDPGFYKQQLAAYGKVTPGHGARGDAATG